MGRNARLPVSVFGPDGKIISDKWWHEPMYKGDCEKLGLDPAVGKKLASLMRGAGLAEVKEIEYPVPIYPSDDLPENQKLIAKLMHGMAWTDGYQRMLMEKISGPTREKDELEKMIKSAEDAYHSIQPGWRSKFFVAVGQKAS